MGLDEIQEIKQTTDDTVVNEYLKKGFKLIKIFSSNIVVGNHELKQPVYILAKGGEEVYL